MSVRTCGLCGKKLSVYNSNKFCFAHVFRGNRIEDARIEAFENKLRRQKDRDRLDRKRERERNADTNNKRAR